jgi:hypothetical protein
MTFRRAAFASLFAVLVYCTCWDGDVRVKTNADGTRFEVETAR